MTVSSTLEDHGAKNIVDENVRSFWVAKKNDDQQWIEIDLQKAADVHAVQVNYNDYKSDMYGRIPGLHHQYQIQASRDGKSWQTIIDKKENMKDVPNDYVEIKEPVRATLHPLQKFPRAYSLFSISGLRVFGKGTGKAPGKVKSFKAQRDEDRRNAQISWDVQKKAQGYNVLWGIAPDKLYNSWLIYDENSLYFAQPQQRSNLLFRYRSLQ